MGLYFSLEILVLLLYLSLFLFPFGKDDLLSLCQAFENPLTILKMSSGLGVVSFSQRIDFSLKNGKICLAVLTLNNKKEICFNILRHI